MHVRKMAYRRRQGVARASTFKEELYHRKQDDDDDDIINNKFKQSRTFSSSSSLAAHHSSPALSSAGSISNSDTLSHRSNSNPKIFEAYEGTSPRNDAKGFWGVLAEKAKSIIEDDKLSSQQQQLESKSKPKSRFHLSDDASPMAMDTSTPTFINSLDNLQIADSFQKQEGPTRASDIIQETRKLQIRPKDQDFTTNNYLLQQPLTPQTYQMNRNNIAHPQQPLTPQTQPRNHETQLKASRDVAMATAAKAKLLLRELKTVKADLAFAKQRCSQLEEENRILRDSRQKGVTAADDDLIRLQLETLLAEKSRLAHQNSMYSRENRFLREIVEFHQLTTQDVVFLDQGSDEEEEEEDEEEEVSETDSVPNSPPQEMKEDPESSLVKQIVNVLNPPLQDEILEDSGNPLNMKENIPALQDPERNGLSNPLQGTAKDSESNVLRNVDTSVSNAPQDSGSQQVINETVNTPDAQK